MRCLILDDDETPRVLMERLINGAGHRATAVAQFSDALMLLEQEQFDVAIVDMEMPDTSGETAIAAIRTRLPELRILVVSGYSDRRHVLAAFDAGADGYILKDELGDTLATSLQDVRAGNTPISSRAAAIVVRQLRFRRFAEGSGIQGTDLPGLPPSTRRR
jgi:DNA-binding NarL/FixJ family response regulator